MKYRDGAFILLRVFADEARELGRAGFFVHPIQLRRDDGTAVEADFWIQDEPSIADFLHASYLLFGDEPGSLNW